MEKLYAEYLTIHNSKLKEGYKPLEVAGVLAAHALSIYKTILSKEDYDAIVDAISNSRDQVISIQPNYNGVTIQ